MQLNSFHERRRALIVTAECDPLHDEGELYGRKLTEAGTPATQLRLQEQAQLKTHDQLQAQEKLRQALVEQLQK